jgi:hypothetical protein
MRYMVPNSRFAFALPISPVNNTTIHSPSSSTAAALRATDCVFTGLKWFRYRIASPTRGFFWFSQSASPWSSAVTLSGVSGPGGSLAAVRGRLRVRPNAPDWSRAALLLARWRRLLASVTVTCTCPHCTGLPL